jgi:hypothetical protein
MAASVSRRGLAETRSDWGLITRCEGWVVSWWSLPAFFLRLKTPGLLGSQHLLCAVGKGAFEFRQYGVHSSQRIVPPLNSAIDFFSLSFFFCAKVCFPPPFQSKADHSKVLRLIQRCYQLELPRLISPAIISRAPTSAQISAFRFQSSGLRSYNRLTNKSGYILTSAWSATTRKPKPPAISYDLVKGIRGLGCASEVANLVAWLAGVQVPCHRPRDSLPSVRD